ncbi:ribonucleoside-diphosphate reductase [bacterium]|nr:ribonucleoside-diphosphate reductase [bacterium]NDC93940.1 ribonucleoside-diphosphate reductase [bacterium]NDD83435.1 ribonucleoside-diphosphate reductase [bacterium]NDG29060.1 ribonucleoside-diphosphate reductase [bacterium]
MELLKQQGSERYTVFPIKYNALWDFYKRAVSAFWTVEEIKLADDLMDWKRLTDSERYFLKNILAFFAASDGIVNENLVINFYNEVQIPEVRQFYAVQMMIEAIHSETYAVLIDTYVEDTSEKGRLFSAIETIPAIKRKADWAIKWIEESGSFQMSVPEPILKELRTVVEGLPKTSPLHYFTRERPAFSQRLLAFVCVEGIFFSGAFCAIYWLKSRGLMPGLSTANQFISRDENLHAEFAIELYKTLCDRLPEDIVHKLFREAVDIEKEFITESLPVSLIGMNCKLMQEYIEMVADRWLVLLGYNKLYNTPNPFPFMELISLNEKASFFEVVNSQYSRANVGASVSDRQISFDCDDF